MEQNGANLTIREYGVVDFPLIEAWWRQHHGNDFRPSYPARFSYIVEIDSQPAAFFGISPQTPAFAYLSFPLVNPGLGKESREKAVDFMIDAAILFTVSNGIPILWYSGNGECFLNRLRAKGWIAGETGCQHMFYKAGEIA
jgi:hypothetical protein